MNKATSKRRKGSVFSRRGSSRSGFFDGDGEDVPSDESDPEWGEEAVKTFTAQLPGTPSDGMGAELVLDAVIGDSSRDEAASSPSKTVEAAAGATPADTDVLAGSSMTGDDEKPPAAATPAAAGKDGIGELPSKSSLGVSSWTDHHDRHSHHPDGRARGTVATSVPTAGRDHHGHHQLGPQGQKKTGPASANTQKGRARGGKSVSFAQRKTTIDKEALKRRRGSATENSVAMALEVQQRRTMVMKKRGTVQRIHSARTLLRQKEEALISREARRSHVRRPI